MLITAFPRTTAGVAVTTSEPVRSCPGSCPEGRAPASGRGRRWLLPAPPVAPGRTPEDEPFITSRCDARRPVGAGIGVDLAVGKSLGKGEAVPGSHTRVAVPSGQVGGTGAAPRPDLPHEAVASRATTRPGASCQSPGPTSDPGCGPGSWRMGSARGWVHRGRRHLRRHRRPGLAVCHQRGARLPSDSGQHRSGDHHGQHQDPPPASPGWRGWAYELVGRRPWCARAVRAARIGRDPCLIPGRGRSKICVC